MPEPELSAPVADRRPTVRVHHGDEFADPYEWLRDKEDADVLGYLKAENEYTEAVTAANQPLVDAVFSEIKARTKETDLSVPSYATHRGGSAYWYYARTVEGSEYAIYCRAPAADRRTPPALEGEIEGEEVLLDANAEAEGHEFFALGAFSISADGRLLAYSVDVKGDERFTLLVKDLQTGALREDRIPDTAYGAAWAGNDHLFYTRADQAWRPYVVLRHRLGTDPATDAEVYTEPDERFWLGVETSRDEEWLIIAAGSKLTSEYRLLPTADPEGEPRVVAPRRQGVEYDVEPAGDRLLITHNDGAEDFAVAEAPLDATDSSAWRPVLPHQPGVRILGVDAYASHVVVSLRRNGLSGLHLIPRDERGDLLPGADIEFDEPLYVVDASGESEYETPTIRLGYASMLTPDSVYDYDLATGEMTLLKRTPVLDDPTFGPYDPARYVQERGWATASDGARVPLSIVRRADVPLDGSAPAVLYGYGSYEASMDPGFSISRLSLLDRGIVYAVAHVRGGGELGRTLVRAGQDAVQDQHLHRLRRLRRLPGHGRLHQRRPAGRPRRQRRRPADGRGGQPRARPVPGHPRLGALRRPADLDPRSRPTADRGRVGGVGQPARGPRGVRVHEVLQPVRERGRPRLPRHPRHHEPERHPGALRRAGQVGRRAAARRRRTARAERSC